MIAGIQLAEALSPYFDQSFSFVFTFRFITCPYKYAKTKRTLQLLFQIKNLLVADKSVKNL